MLFTEKVREDLECEVRARGFDVFFRESLRRHEALAAFESAGALLTFLRGTEEREAAKDAATVALLRAYEGATRHRAQIGALLLLVLWPDVAGVVRAKTRQVCRKAGFRSTDADDVEQILVLDLLKRLPRFDPSRASLRTFVARLLDHAVATIIESRQAARRDWRRDRASLHDLVDSGDGGVAPRSETLDGRRCRGRLLRVEELDEPTLRELRADVASSLAAMPPELRRFARRLMEATPTEVARATSTPRSTLYEAMRRIRGFLDGSDVADYALPRRRHADGPGRCVREDLNS